MTDLSRPTSLVVHRVDTPDFLVDPSVLSDPILWRIDLNALAQSEARWRSILSSDERARADRFHFECDRQHFCAARAALRTVLGSCLSIAPQDVLFRYSEKGKPELAAPQAGSGLQFNISHSGGIALLGITWRRPIGVDVEKIRDDFDTGAIARRFFSAGEQEELAQLPVDQRHRAFFRCWTLKEAFIKALGEGLSHPLHQFDVSVSAQAPVSLTTRPDPVEAENWQLLLVEAGSDHTAALALRRR